MRAEDRDPALLYAMLASARHALEWVDGMDFDAFAADRMAHSAAQAVLGTMGRAAGKVSASARSAAPDVEWQRMAEFADYLLHDYDKVTPEEVWTELRETVPVVIGRVEPLLPPIPEGGPANPNRDAVPRLDIPAQRIMDFCRKWRVDELALFGSVLRDDFGPESDVDVLVTYAPDAGISLFDHVDLQDDLEAIFGHRVDLVSRRGLEHGGNPFSIHNILGSARVIYPSAASVVARSACAGRGGVSDGELTREQTQ